MSINNIRNHIENDKFLSRAVESNTNIANNLDIENIGSRVSNITNSITTNNPIITGNNNDLLVAEEGNGLLSGGNGSDIIFGGEGDTELRGGNRTDFIYGEQGDDEIYGGNGDDYLNSGEGNDNIFGGNGNDVIVAGSGNNRVNGGNGQDTIIFDASSDDFSFSFDEDYNIVITDNSNPENQTIISGVENFIFISDDNEEVYSIADIEDVINDSDDIGDDPGDVGNDNDPLLEQIAALGLAVSDNDEYLNWSGELNEKWLMSNDQEWYYIIPSGELYKWDSKSKDGMLNGQDSLIGNIGEDFYSDLTMFQNISLEGGEESNSPPNIDDLELQIDASGNDYFNWSDGLNEKWLKGESELWYYMLENGDLYRWDSQSQDGMFNGEDTLIGNIGEDIYNNPALLNQS